MRSIHGYLRYSANYFKSRIDLLVGSNLLCCSRRLLALLDYVSRAHEIEIRPACTSQLSSSNWCHMIQKGHVTPTATSSHALTKAERFCQIFGNCFHHNLTLCAECFIRNWLNLLLTCLTPAVKDGNGNDATGGPESYGVALKEP